MCGFIITNLPDPDLESANYYVRHRGPDGTNTIEFHGLTFLHNVLSITGNLTFQPFVKEEIACLFNGEIYNHQQFGDFASDGECLIPAFQQHGKYFVNQLDGEFAIVLYDAAQKVLRLYTDVFATKPIHYATDGQKFAVASYASALRSLGFDNPKKLVANSLVEILINDGSQQLESGLYAFNLDQYKNNFEDWNKAFAESIAKRARHTREQIFIGLSSGYDSGGIACELNAQDVDYKSYSLFGIEDREILEQRLRIIDAHAHAEVITPSKEDIRAAARYVKDHIEETILYIYSEGTGHIETPDLHKDGGAVGLAMICARAKAEGRKIYLSGQGADEIFADYGFAGERFYPHSNFGGLFPDKLEEIFPWASFYGSSQESYLRKEEYVAGSFGIETRYPYLDKRVVQEFLNLSPKLKNWCYKSVLRNYLENHQFPTLFDKKIGFYPK